MIYLSPLVTRCHRSIIIPVRSMPTIIVAKGLYGGSDCYELPTAIAVGNMIFSKNYAAVQMVGNKPKNRKILKKNFQRKDQRN